MFADLIILSIGFLGIIIGSITDIQKREVADFINYFMIFSGLGIRLIYSIYTLEWNYFIFGLLGFGSFLVLAYLMFLTGQWGGGDSKMLMGMGALFATYPESLRTFFSPNLLGLPFLVSFWINLLLLGAIYGVLWTIGLGIVRFKDFRLAWNERIKMKIPLSQKFEISAFKFVFFLSSFFLAVGIFLPSLVLRISFIVISIMVFSFFCLIVFVKSVDKACMYKVVDYSGLVPGDWLLDDVVVEHDKNDNFYKKFKKQFSYISDTYRELDAKYIHYEFITSCYLSDNKINIFLFLINYKNIKNTIENLSNEIEFDFKTKSEFISSLCTRKISFLNKKTINKVLKNIDYSDFDEDIFMIDHKDYFIRMEFLKLCYMSYGNFLGKLILPFKVNRFKKLIRKIKIDFDTKEEFIEYYANLEMTDGSKIPFLSRKVISSILSEELLYDDKKLYVAGRKATGLNYTQLEHIEELSYKGKIGKIKIRHGIPFVPSFFFALIVTFVYGNIIVLFL